MRWAAKRDANEEEVVQALERAGWTVVKVSSPGVADLLCVRQGVVRLLEVKRRGGRLAEAQQRTHDRLRAAGLTVPIARTPEQALEAVRGAP